MDGTMRRMVRYGTAGGRSEREELIVDKYLRYGGKQETKRFFGGRRSKIHNQIIKSTKTRATSSLRVHTTKTSQHTTHTNATMSTVDEITADLKALYAEKNCGPIMIRLSWHDAGVYSTGKLTGGCPNAAMRFTDGGEGCFGANAGELKWLRAV